MTDILLIDDDPLLRRGLAFSLERAGYRVRTAADAVTGLEMVRTIIPDLVILDIGLPGLDGLDAMHMLKTQYQIPVILLTARRTGKDEALGLDLGADDYITKPHDMDQLLARIRAVLRRYLRQTIAPKTASLTYSTLNINPQSHSTRIGDQELDLPPREFGLLYALVAKAGQVIPADTLITTVWGDEFEGEPQVLYVTMSKIREKLTAVPGHNLRIVTAHRVGYKIIAGES